MNFHIIKKNKFGLDKIFPVVIFLSLCLLSFNEADAQTKRRKKSNIPQPVSTPVPNSNLIIPEIVSRADENEVQNPVVSNDDSQTVEETEDVETLKNRVTELNEKIRQIESLDKGDADAKQKKLLMNLDILSRAEQRAESLQKQLYEVIEKENSVKSRIDQIVYDMRPEMIDRSAAYTGSLRPEDVRDARRKSLESEKTNLESLLAQIQSNRAKLEQSVERADLLVDRIRLKFEKEIDDALIVEEKP